MANRLGSPLRELYARLFVNPCQWLDEARAVAQEQCRIGDGVIVFKMSPTRAGHSCICSYIY
jgi:hypothetical protein